MHHNDRYGVSVRDDSAGARIAYAAGVANSDYLNPFVLSVETRPAERRGTVDLYLPDATQPQPAIVFVHGGPLPEPVRPRPRDWPVYQAYGSMAAAAGLVGVTVDHR